MTDFYVSITPREAMKIIDNAIVNGSITGEQIDEYINDMGNGTMVAVMVYEKHYYRAGNRLTLTVVVDNLRNGTHIHTVGSGGGQGFFKFDWGASGSFEDCVSNALYQYIIK